MFHNQTDYQDTPEQVTHIIEEDDHAVMSGLLVGVPIEDCQEVQHDKPSALRIWELHPREHEATRAHQPQCPSRHICEFDPSPDTAARELESLPPSRPHPCLKEEIEGMINWFIFHMDRFMHP